MSNPGHKHRSVKKRSRSDINNSINRRGPSGRDEALHATSTTALPDGNTLSLDSGINFREAAGAAAAQILGRSIMIRNQNEERLSVADMPQQNSMHQQQRANLSNGSIRQHGTGDPSHHGDRIDSMLSPLRHPTLVAQLNHSDNAATIQGILNQMDQTTNLDTEQQLLRRQLLFQQHGLVGASGLASAASDIQQVRQLSLLSNLAGGSRRTGDSSQILNDLAASQGYQQLVERHNASVVLEGLLANSEQQLLPPSSFSNEAATMIQQAMLQRHQRQHLQQEEANDALLRLMLHQQQLQTIFPQDQSQMRIQRALDQLVTNPSTPHIAGGTAGTDQQLLALLRGQNSPPTPSTSSLLSQGGLLSSATTWNGTVLSSFLQAPIRPQRQLHPQELSLVGRDRVGSTVPRGSASPLLRGREGNSSSPRIANDGKFDEDEGKIEERIHGWPPGFVATRPGLVDTVEATPKDAFKDRDVNGRAKTLPTLLVMPSDSSDLSEHQTLLRYQIEVFRAEEEDVATHTRGRNKPVELGQIGLRCRHCKVLPVSERLRGSVYFPRAVEGFYQAAQNMNSTHLQTGECPCMGDVLRKRFAELIANRGGSNGAGRSYWAKQARALGLDNTDDGIIFVGWQD
jgi:hypothetical protein